MAAKVVILAVIAAALFAVALGVTEGEYDLDTHPRALWKQWRLDNPSITFDDDNESERRYAIFAENVLRVKNLNAAQGPDTHYMLNKFAHMSVDEFKAQYLNEKLREQTPFKRDEAPQLEINADRMAALPTAFDWRSKTPPVVAPIKDQGPCGSCWAFSTNSNIEGQWAIAGNKLVSLSEQNLVDCCHECWHPGVCDQGCEGGLMANTFTCVIKQGGVDTEASYPYVALDGFCKFKPANVGAEIDSFAFVEQNEDAIAGAVVNHGPISVAVDASQWQFYKTGVYKGPCSSEQLNHAVVIVGYGVHVVNPPVKYWIIRNSWGTAWGEKGYMKLIRNGNECGILEYPITSVINQ